MTKNIDWPDYLRAITDNAPGNRIAELSGVGEATVSRWLAGTYAPKPQQVVVIARLYGVHPLQALVAAGYLTPEEVDLAAITPRKLQLREFTELEIAEEMVRRISEGEATMLETPLNGDHPAMGA